MSRRPRRRSTALRSAGVRCAIFLVASQLACSDAVESGANGVWAIPQRYLLVSNASVDFQTGTYALLDRETLRARADLGALHSDSGVRESGGYLFGINRRGADNLQRLDPRRLTTLWQYSTGAGSNPQDVIVVAEDKAYVTRYELATLLVVDPEARSEAEFAIGEIDLSEFADADGIPEMHRLALVDGLAWVSLQRLDREVGFAPTEGSVLVAIDPASDEVVTLHGQQRTVALPVPNPMDMRVIGGQLWVACAGRLGEEDGALLVLDGVDSTPRPVVTEAELGGDISAFTATNPIFAITTDDAFRARVSVVDGGTGAVIGILVEDIPYTADIEADDVHVYVPDRDLEHPGIRVYDRFEWSPVSDSAISTGLPPWSIELVTVE